MSDTHRDPPDRGVLVVVSGPSGVGKSTLIRHAREVIPDLVFSVSATTRSPRPGEVDGVDYHFLSADRFSALVADGAFLEHARVYDRRYGTLLAPIQEALTQGRSVLLDVDVKGGAQVRESLPEAILLFVAPPTRAALEERLRRRGSEDDATIARRMALATEQFAGSTDYDYVVVNQNLTRAQQEFVGIIRAEGARMQRRHRLLRSLVTG